MKVLRDIWEHLFACCDIDFNDLKLSGKDKVWLSLAEFPTYFTYKKRVLTPEQ